MHRQSNASASNRVSMLIFIAWRNIWRNRVRSFLTIAALVGALIMVILYAGLLEGMSRQMVRAATEVNLGHMQVHREAFVEDQDLYATLPWSWMERIEQVHPGIRVAPRLYAAGLASTEESANGVMIKAVDPAREPAVTSMLSHVRRGELDLGPATSSAEGLPRDNVVVGAQLAKNMNLTPGSELVLVTQAADGSIGNALYRVAAVLKPLEPNFDRTGILMSVEAFQLLMALDDGFHELAVVVDDLTALEPLQTEIRAEVQRLLNEQPLDELGGAPLVRNWRELSPGVADMLELSGVILLVVGFIVVGLASLGMLNTMLMAVHERAYEFGILLAIGMKRRWLLLMVLLESLFLSLVAALGGAVLGVLLVRYFEEEGIDFSEMMPDGYDWAGIVFEPVMYTALRMQDVFNACVLMILITLVASLIPSWRLVRLKPVEVMR